MTDSERAAERVRVSDLEAALRKIELVAGGSPSCARCFRIHEIAHRARTGKNWEDIDGRT